MHRRENQKYMSKRELCRGAEELEGVTWKRPRTRGDCEALPRPCPIVSCRYNLRFDVAENGSIIWTGQDEPAPERSCVLDVADRHPEGITLDEAGKIFGVTRERIRQIQQSAMRKLGGRPCPA